MRELMTTLSRPWAGGEQLSAEFETALRDAFSRFPHRVTFRDFTGREYAVGGNEPHWCGRSLRVHVKTEDAARDALRLDGLRFLERFLQGEVDFEGNMYAFQLVRKHTKLHLKPWHLLTRAVKIAAFQNERRATVNVKSHYDIPQGALDVYLDRVYRSYSCGIWERPDDLLVDDMLRVGEGKTDSEETLEKAQWRKFKDAVDWIAPAEGETMLDIGCGYGGQLAVALEEHPFGKVVGWTHSSNQAREGKALLSRFAPERYELEEGDYRQDDRVFDHVTSTGMISHVGPRGLVPYVRNVRRRIRDGGRYLHHSLMTAHHPRPLDSNVGIAFNKKYVWPGFHWFTLGEHVRALEKNGFVVERVRNLTRHYAKTTASWHERMMANADVMRRNLGEPTFRAWRVFLAGSTGAFLADDIHVCRLYCYARRR